MTTDEQDPRWLRALDFLWALAGPTVLFAAAGLSMFFGVVFGELALAGVGVILLFVVLVLFWQWSRPRSPLLFVEVVRSLVLSLPVLCVPSLILLKSGLPAEQALERWMLVSPRTGALLGLFALVFVFVLKLRLSRPEERWVGEIWRWY